MLLLNVVLLGSVIGADDNGRVVSWTMLLNVTACSVNGADDSDRVV